MLVPHITGGGEEEAPATEKVSVRQWSLKKTLKKVKIYTDSNVTWLFSEAGSVPAAAAAPDPACSLVLDWVVVEGPAITKVLKSRRI